MESILLQLLRHEGAAAIVKQVNSIAVVQREESSKGLKLFFVPAPSIDTKEEYWNMSRPERLAWQRAQEVERRRLNKEQGIDGNSLLTKENVESWRAEGKTFAAIARDYIGCTEQMVSDTLKGTKKPFNAIRRSA
jgi:hypothetical protein